MLCSTLRFHRNSDVSYFELAKVSAVLPLTRIMENNGQVVFKIIKDEAVARRVGGVQVRSGALTGVAQAGAAWGREFGGLVRKASQQPFRHGQSTSAAHRIEVLLFARW
jgi:hypothetical protein